MQDPYDREFNPLFVVVSGPAGVGKDAALNCLKGYDHPFHFVVTTTDRPPRPKEVDGVDYFFVSTAEFERMIEEDELLEHAVVYGQHKGIPRQQIREALASGKDVVMRIDVQGAATIRCLVPEAVLIFLAAPSEEELERRLRKRGTDTPEQIERRMATSREEMARLPEFDYIVFNYDRELNQAVEAIHSIVQAEHCRVVQRVVEL